MKKEILIMTAGALAATAGITAGVPTDLLSRYQVEANETLNADRGRALFQKDVAGKSCTNCHTSDIRQVGRERFLLFSKRIGPMALSVNPRRFQKPEATEKGFNKYCQEVFGRQCTPREKGDLLLYFTQN